MSKLFSIFAWFNFIGTTGSHFHDWIDYNGVAFSTELLEWGRIFSGLWGKNILASSKFGY